MASDNDIEELANAVLSGEIDRVKSLFPRCRSVLDNLIAAGPGAGMTPIWVAAKNKKWDIVDYLLDEGADFTITPPEKPTFLALAVGRGQLEFVKKLFVKDSSLLNIVSNVGNHVDMTPIWIAASGKKWDIVDYLLDEGADITIAPPGKPKLLTLAAGSGQLELVKKLFVKNSSLLDIVSKVDSYTNVTPIWIAAKNQKWNVVEYLRKKGADITITPPGKRTFLALIAHHGQIELLIDLVQCGENINEIYSDDLTNVIALLEKNLLDNIKSKHATEIIIASLIWLRKGLYNHSLLEYSGLRAPEINEHDFNFAKQSLSKVKEYLDENNQKNIPTFADAVISIQNMLIARIQKSNATPELQNTLDPYDNEKFLAIHDKSDQNQLAFLWVTTFLNSMPHLGTEEQKKGLEVIRKMLPYILACRNATMENCQPTSETETIDTAISFQLSNLMKANEDLMSCPLGTPRGFRMIFDTFLSIKVPQHLQHEQVKQSAFSVINKLMLDKFNDIKTNFNLDDLFADIEMRAVTTLSDAEMKQINDVKNSLGECCDRIAMMGSDNIAMLLDRDDIEALNSGIELSIEHVLLHIASMQEVYPTYDKFEAAVLANMQMAANQPSELDKQYLQLQYLAISDEEIRPKLYDILEAEVSKISNKVEKYNTTAKILDAILKYKNDNSIINKQNLKNVLKRAISLIVAEVNLEARDTVIDNIINNMPNYRNNLSIIEAKILFNQLKTDYDAGVNRKRKRLG